MIIDSRCRPALESFLVSTVGPAGAPVSPFARFGVSAPSILQRSLELFFQEMEEAGITYAVAPARWSFGNHEEDPLVPADDVVQMVTKYPRKIYGAIAISARHIYRSLTLIEKYVVHGPVRGVCLEPGMQGMYIDDKRLYAIYDFLQESEIPLFLLSGGGNGPTISYANPEHLDQMLVDFPSLTVIGCHGAVPYPDQDIFVAFRRRNYYPCPDVYLPDSPYARPYIEAANHMLKDQMLFGTAYPFISMKEGVDKFMQFPIRPEVLDNILYKNAARALKIDLSKIG